MEFAAGAGLQILIVEDDAVDRKQLARLLAASSLKVGRVVAKDHLAGALEELSEGTFDIVLLDLGLPDSEGIDSFTEIARRCPDVPVIVLSGLDDEEVAIQAVQKGVQDYLTKGQFGGGLLVRAIRYAIERKKGEQQLQSAEQRYRTIFENSAVGIMMVDEQERLVSWNTFTERLLGMEADDLRLRDIKSLYPEKEWEQIRAHNVRRKGMQHHLETKMIKKDGQVIDVDVSLSVLRDSESNIVGSIGVIRDITERKRAEEKLESSYSLLHATLESTADGILVVDNKGHVASYNQKFAQMWRLPASILATRDDDALLAYVLDQLTAPDEFIRRVKELYDSPDQESRDMIEFKDGRVFDRYSQPQKVGGEVCGRVCSFRDITERRHIHEILDRKQKNLEAIFDAAPLGMLLIGDDLKIKRANEAIKHLSGRGFSEIIGQLPGTVLDCSQVGCTDQSGEGARPACASCVLKMAIRGALDSGKSTHGVEMQVAREVQEGESRPWLSVSVEPVDIDGLNHAVVAINDITERKLAEEELKETMELKAQFISTVSHELRTPLTSMKEAVMIVLDGVAGKLNDDQGHFLDIAKRNIDRLSRLINDVLDFQKLGSGQMKFNMQANDIRRVIEDACTTMGPHSKKKNITLSVETQGQIPDVVCDSDRIIQVVTNLVSNAIKFTPEDGQVRVVAKRRDEGVVISVSDTGMGIPKDALPKVFERFYRVSRPGKEIKGTGLGLAIVNRIVAAHGGRIEVESEVDQGTTFTVHLPLTQAGGGEALAVSQDETLEATLAKQ